jgi:hypothetical protein
LKEKLINRYLSVLIVPLISTLIIYTFYKIIPLLFSQDTLPFQLSTLTMTKLIALLCAIIIPLITSNIYKIRLIVLTLIWIPLTGLALFLDAGIYDGHPATALAMDIFPYQLLSVFLTICFIVIRKK